MMVYFILQERNSILIFDLHGWIERIFWVSAYDSSTPAVVWPDQAFKTWTHGLRVVPDHCVWHQHKLSSGLKHRPSGRQVRRISPQSEILSVRPGSDHASFLTEYPLV
jgi:hypothetical protein